MASDDPRAIRSIAVTREDVVMALEANETGGDPPTVLRVTPPFSGRMRARIHVASTPDDDAVHVRPERLVADPPAYPHPDDTEDALRADPDDAYTPERHRRRHVAAVERWRDRVRTSVVDGVTLDLPDGTHQVTVDALG